ncbi:hypothetical protein [Sulfuricella sp. T08]|uniref:hypothetical protein n=1 Tax=Sulfuricella sp. T08 TaxID=1632857 RepID=UPI00075136D2|nr:hypothetical protein [Sulfuricella sp. T08]
MAWMLLGWIALWIKAWFARGCRREHGSRVRGLRLAIRSPPKPAWVTREIIRLKVLMPDAGCRTLSLVFNRRHAASRKMTVGKTFVADALRRHRYEIEVMRRKLKHRVPPALPCNLVWAMDLTGKGDAAENMHMIFGLIDHGSRALLSLTALPDKCSREVTARLKARKIRGARSRKCSADRRTGHLVPLVLNSLRHCVRTLHRFQSCCRFCFI